MKDYTENNNLEYLRDNKIPVTLYFTNGFQHRGYIVDFDATTILFRANDKLNHIYKHAISTIEYHA